MLLLCIKARTQEDWCKMCLKEPWQSIIIIEAMFVIHMLSIILYTSYSVYFSLAATN